MRSVKELVSLWKEWRPLQAVIKTKREIQSDLKKKLRLPWFGIASSTQDQKALKELVHSSSRLNLLKEHEGWADLVAIYEFWLSKYDHEATKVGRSVVQEGPNGERSLVELEDSEQDDRRRLIAAAQRSALKGFFSEIEKRIVAGQVALKRLEDATRGEDKMTPAQVDQERGKISSV